MKTSEKMKYDVIVIGSGFGGATSAARLAKSGMKVCILEKGVWWGKSQKHKPFPENPFSTARAMRNVQVSNNLINRTITFNRQGLFEIQSLNGWNLVNGVGVGGSSLIYVGITHRPAEDFFDSFPAEITWSEMEPYFSEIEKTLNASVSQEVSDKTRYYERIFGKFAKGKFCYLPQAISWGKGRKSDHTIENSFGVKQKNCTFCNQCTGCNRGAKNSLDLNMIADAVNSGAEIRTNCDVDVISKGNSGYNVRYRNLQSKQLESVEAPKVVLAAGTVNTHRILFRSRTISNGLQKLSGMLGERVSLGGDSMRFMPVRKKFTWERGHLVEGAMEVFDENNQRDHLIFPGEMLFYNLPWMRPIRGAFDRILPLTGFGRDNADGRFTWDGKQLLLKKPDQPTVGRIYSNMDMVAEHYSNKRKGNSHSATGKSAKARKGIICLHPMGGCRVGDTIESGVVDHRGEVFNYPGLYVADASIFAGPPVSAPSMTIAAMALRISDMIIAE